MPTFYYDIGILNTGLSRVCGGHTIPEQFVQSLHILSAICMYLAAPLSLIPGISLAYPTFSHMGRCDIMF